MTVDSAEISLQREWSNEQALPSRPKRLGVRLTYAERRLLLGVVDLLLINAALLIAGIVWGEFPRSLAELGPSFKWFVTLSVVWLTLAAALDAYNPARAASTSQNILHAGLAALLAAVLYLAIPWLTPPLGRRLLAFSFIGLSVMGVTAWRVLYAQVFFQPSFRHRVLMLGGGDASYSSIRELQAAASKERANPFRGTGYVVVGYVGDEAGSSSGQIEGVPILKPGQDLLHQARQLGVDEIIVADEAYRSPALRETLMDCCEMGLRLTRLSDVYERLTARLPVEWVEHLGFIAGTADSPAERLYRFSKRALDILIALVGVALVVVLSPWIWLANAYSSPGPLFYRQHRVGRGGRPFVMIKFRTMVPQAEATAGAVWATDDDQRVTRVGYWLRKTHIDELPQFINVLKGEMSVVGPRPERPQFVGELFRVLPLYRARHAVKPGITGWAQVRYCYGNSVQDAKKKLEYDLYYVKHASFFLDTLIMLQTIPTMLKFKGY